MSHPHPPYYPPLKIIGITGPAGAGKDTVGTLLRDHLGFRTVAFADSLRAEVLAAFPDIELPMLTDHRTKELPTPLLALERCTDQDFEAAMISHHHRTLHQPLLDMTLPRSPRQILQWWGTDYRRARNHGYWVRKMLNGIKHFHGLGIAHRFAITDVRFENEAQLVREMAGQLWQVHREGLSIAPGAHPSETTGAAFGPHAVIDNSGTIDQLREQVLGEAWRHEAGLKRVTVEIEA